MSDSYKFPADFLWGTSTSAYQIEGSPTADGAGPSIWHRFSHTPGNTYMDQTGDVTADHYGRYKEDIALMSELGTNAYRFSIAWGRIIPNGTGAINKRGIDHYSRLVDELLKRNIKPNVTLYHWDLPEALDNRGGWLNRDIADWFCDYAITMFDALGDRVEMWSTLNEPWVVTDGGYLRRTTSSARTGWLFNDSAPPAQESMERSASSSTSSRSIPLRARPLICKRPSAPMPT